MKNIMVKLNKHESDYKWLWRTIQVVGWVYLCLAVAFGWVGNIETKDNAKATYLAKTDATEIYLCKKEAKNEYVKKDVYDGDIKVRELRWEIVQTQMANVSDVLNVPKAKRQKVRELTKKLLDTDGIN